MKMQVSTLILLVAIAVLGCNQTKEQSGSEKEEKDKKGDSSDAKSDGPDNIAKYLDDLGKFCTDIANIVEPVENKETEAVAIKEAEKFKPRSEALGKRARVLIDAARARAEAGQPDEKSFQDSLQELSPKLKPLFEKLGKDKESSPYPVLGQAITDLVNIAYDNY